MTPELAQTLTRLADHTDYAARLHGDPVAFVHRYTAPADQEVAAVFASALAYGRVSLFWPILERWFEQLDAGGGPAAYVREARPTGPLDDLVYRFNNGRELQVIAQVLSGALKEHGSLGALFQPHADAPHVGPALARFVDDLRARACAIERVGQPAELSYGLRYWLASPRSGGACKRWMMFLRWMVRPTDGGVDLHLWRHVSPRLLLMPVDVHVGRIARLVGLTTRKSNDLKTSIQIRDALAQIDPADPIRFDFALAHLGIHDGCKGSWVREICSHCALATVCVAARTGYRHP